MTNFFSDNKDLVAHFSALDLTEIVSVLEDDFAQADKFEEAPENYSDAISLYGIALEIVGKIAAEIIEPQSAAVDSEGAHFDAGNVTYARGTHASIEALADGGFMGVIVPREYGGANFPAIIYMMMIEIVSRADASFMTLFGYQDVGESIAKYGTSDVASEFLPKYTKGEELGAMVLSEPGAGSDLQGIRLRASCDADGNWVLNGTKHFISNGCGKVLLVLARSVEGSKGAFGLSLFACRNGDQVKINRIEEKMGLHGSPTCELLFEDAPAKLVGREGMGLLKYVLEILNHARFSVAAQGLGIAEAAYSEALSYAQQRRQFGKFIVDMPQVATMLADMRTDIVCARTLLYAGAKWLDTRNKLEEKIERLKHRGEDAGDLQERFQEASRFVDLLSPLTKYWVTEKASRICYDAQQVHGGLGYMKEYKVERLVRDVRITTIYEGTSQVQVGASINGVLDDVLGSEIARLPLDNAGSQYSSATNNLKSAAELLQQCREIVHGSEEVELRQLAAKDLCDVYVGLYVGHLLLKRSDRSDALDSIIERHCAQTVVKGSEALAGLQTKRWQSSSEAKTICEIAK